MFLSVNISPSGYFTEFLWSIIHLLWASPWIARSYCIFKIRFWPLITLYLVNSGSSMRPLLPFPLHFSASPQLFPRLFSLPSPPTLQFFNFRQSLSSSLFQHLIFHFNSFLFFSFHFHFSVISSSNSNYLAVFHHSVLDADYGRLRSSTASPEMLWRFCSSTSTELWPKLSMRTIPSQWTAMIAVPSTLSKITPCLARRAAHMVPFL